MNNVVVFLSIGVVLVDIVLLILAVRKGDGEEKHRGTRI
jgi:hypothetical protein